ncbi:hypothetical protein ACFC7A_10215 [Streptomyces niveus]|uniref:hypothetical protein n=1 Tax=Streptomyces niveus TaxID=193462 RepID=UPI0035DB9E21
METSLLAPFAEAERRLFEREFITSRLPEHRLTNPLPRERLPPCGNGRVDRVRLLQSNGALRDRRRQTVRR